MKRIIYIVIISFIVTMTSSAFSQNKKKETITIINTQHTYSQRIELNETNNEARFLIDNKSGTDLSFKTIEPTTYGGPIQGEESFEVNQGLIESIIVRYDKSKHFELETKEYTVKYKSYKFNYELKFSIHIVNNKKQQHKKYSFLTFSDPNKTEKRIKFDSPGQIRRIKIRNTGTIDVQKNKLIINPLNLECFTYLIPEIFPVDLLQQVEFRFIDNESCSKLEDAFSERVTIKNGDSNTLYINIDYSPKNAKVDKLSTSSSLKSEKTSTTTNNIESLNNWETSFYTNHSLFFLILIPCILIFIFLLFYTLFNKRLRFDFPLLKTIKTKVTGKEGIGNKEQKLQEKLEKTEKELKEALKKLEETQKELKTTKDDLKSKNNKLNQEKLEKTEKELKEALQKLEEISQELKTAKDDLNSKCITLKNQADSIQKNVEEVNYLKTQIANIERENKLYREQLFQLTVEKFKENNYFQNIFSLDANDKNEWNVLHHEHLLAQFQFITEECDRFKNEKTALVEAFKPAVEYWHIPQEFINKPVENKLRTVTVISEHIEFYQKSESETPHFIFIFEYWLESAINEVDKLSKKAGSNSGIKGFLNNIHKWLKKIKENFGISTDRSKLYEKFGLDINNPFSIRTLTPEQFASIILNKDFTPFNDIIKLNIYINTVYKELSDHSDFTKSNIDEKEIYALVKDTKKLFQKLFNIKFTEVNLFKDKFDKYLHEESHDNQPYITALFQDAAPLISSSERNTIIDIFLVGISSDTQDMNKPPIVVVKP